MSEEAIRLQKFLASAGIASRRDAEKIIENGEITVNGKKASLGQKVKVGRDVVKYKGKVVDEPEKITLLFHKPRGFLCNNDGRDRDESDTLNVRFPELKPYPVVIGLEKEAAGLILLSNDGDLHQQIASRYKNIRRGFLVRVKNEIAEKDLLRLTGGVHIDGTRFAIDEIKHHKPDENSIWYKLLCTNQKDKMLEKLFSAIQHPLQRVVQIEFAGISDQKLKKGTGRIMTHKEISILKDTLGIE